MSTAVFDALPGLETPVADVSRTLANVWDMEPVRGKPAPSEFRASQMNLVVHLGLDSKPEQALETFNAAVSFSRRYPCRIITLCPREYGGGGEVSAKIFCECYIGKSRHEMTCSEAIILTYPLEQRAYLENQASIMLESDLPVYYWPQRISSASRMGDYKFFLKEAQRVIIDSAIEKPDVTTYPWPRPEVVRDLVFARMLPVRQSVGHFLSYVPPDRLLEGLQGVTLRHRPEYHAEAAVLARWVRSGLEGCAKMSGAGAPIPEAQCESVADLGYSLVMNWAYAQCNPMRLEFDFGQGTAHLTSCFKPDTEALASAVRPLAPESALAEAVFF